jgi:hypothetical protein
MNIIKSNFVKVKDECVSDLNDPMYNNKEARWKNHPDITPLAHDVYIYKNYLKEDADDYLKELENLTEEQWYTHCNLNKGDLQETIWDGRVSLDIMKHKTQGDMFNFFAPEHTSFRLYNFVRMLKGDSGRLWTKDRDAKDFDYRIGLYVGNFKGGEICLPELNMKIKPSHGDLIIARYSYDYYISEVTEGVRYSYIDFLMNPSLDSFF